MVQSGAVVGQIRYLEGLLFDAPDLPVSEKCLHRLLLNRAFRPDDDVGGRVHQPARLAALGPEGGGAQRIPVLYRNDKQLGSVWLHRTNGVGHGLTSRNAQSLSGYSAWPYLLAQRNGMRNEVTKSGVPPLRWQTIGMTFSSHAKTKLDSR